MSNTQEPREAPGFERIDAAGKTISLSDYTDHKNVLLVFNRGFA